MRVGCWRSRPGAQIRITRKISCIFALLLTASLTLGAGVATAAGGHRHEEPRPDLVRAGLAQQGESLIASIRTAKPVALARLDPLPKVRAAGASYLCVELLRPRGGGRRLCLGGGNAHRRVGLEVVNSRGRTTAKRAIAARVKRPDSRKLVITLLPGRAGLSPHHYLWRARDGRGSLPRKGSRAFRLRPVRAVGCTGGDEGIVANGPRDHGVVALTFDDGPSEYTPAFLDVLREKHAVGTFFEIGQEMPGREDTMRRILAEGSEIGDHTMNHVELPDYSQIAGAAGLIDSSTHFAPCLFRPPGGAVDSSVIGNAAALGMLTVTWDVDPADWTNPGSGAVYSRVVDGAQAGSIILMHDGGGDRSGTLAALPSIIDTLRARGYRFATVSALLGRRLIYRPYG